MNIGRASKLSGVSTKMIRYYEQTGLIPKAARHNSGYRDYDDADVHRLRFIRRSRDLGFTVEQIGGLLDLWSDRSRASSDVKSFALEHVQRLKEKMAEIEAMVRTLESLADHCHGDDRPECPIIEGLAEDDGDSLRPKRREPQRFGRPGGQSARPHGAGAAKVTH
jgi:Cu(I)-responsive transcriptional regulator